MLDQGAVIGLQGLTEMVDVLMHGGGCGVIQARIICRTLFKRDLCFAGTDAQVLFDKIAHCTFDP